MNISKSSWHYRFNNWIQDNFEFRVRYEKITTCGYIATTIRSMFQGLFNAWVIAVIGFICGWLVASGVAGILAPIFGFTLPKIVVVGAVITYTGCFILAMSIFGHVYVAPYLKRKHDERISLLEQRIKDGKEGICTILEFVE